MTGVILEPAEASVRLSLRRKAILLQTGWWLPEYKLLFFIVAMVSLQRETGTVWHTFAILICDGSLILGSFPKPGID